MNGEKDKLERLLGQLHSDATELLSAEDLPSELKPAVRRIAKRCLKLSQQLGKINNPKMGLLNRIRNFLVECAAYLSLWKFYDD